MECKETCIEIIPKVEPSDKIIIDLEIPFHLLEYLNSDDCNLHNLCRLCLTVSEDMTSLTSVKKFGVLGDMLSSFTSLQVDADDTLPIYICELCKTQVINCYEFKAKCEKSNHILTMLFKKEFNAKEYTEDKTDIEEDIEKNDLVISKIKDDENLNEDAANYESNHFLRDSRKDKMKFELNRNIHENYLEDNEPRNEVPMLCEGMQYLATMNDVDSDEESLCIVQKTGTRTNKKLKITIAGTGSFLDHMVTHKKNTLRSKKTYDCTICTKKFYKIKSLNSHVKQAHGDEKSYSHSCEQCNECFSSEHDLHLHIAIHSKGPVWTCNKCHKEFKGRSKLSRHIQRHMESKRYSCETCRKPFAEMYALRRHQRVHTGEAVEKKHFCHLCDKRYASGAQLAVHVARHAGARSCVCVDCGKAFASPRLLASHRLVHSDAKPYACIYCDKRFRHESTRNTHHRTHTGEKPYVCSACGKTFIQNSNLTLHMRVHTGEKPYSCATCGRRFTAGSSLKNHQRTHTGEKPFACTICGKRFARRDLRAHIRRHTGERPFACHVCPKKFVNATRLRDHCRIHTGEKPYECDTCSQKFVTKSHLMKHMNSHQKKKKINKKGVVLVREIDYHGAVMTDQTQHIPAETDNSMSNGNVLETEEVPLEVTEELVLQDNNEVKTEILVVDNSQNDGSYQNSVCLTDGVTFINNDVSYDGEVNLVAVNEGEVSISSSSAMLEGATVKVYQLDQSLVQIHSSGGQVTISKITSKMTANF